MIEPRIDISSLGFGGTKKHIKVSFKGTTYVDFGNGPRMNEGPFENLSFQDHVKELTDEDFELLVSSIVGEGSAITLIRDSAFPLERWAAQVQLQGYDRGIIPPLEVIHFKVEKVHRLPHKPLADTLYLVG